MSSEIKQNPSRDDYSSWLQVSPQVDSNQVIDFLKNTEIDLLLTDHYGLGADWETAVRPWVKSIAVLDDLENRLHDCDVLIDTNFGKPSSAYKELVPSDCQRLLGPKYCLLRPEFKALRSTSLDRRKESKFERLLITFGGYDTQNGTEWALQTLHEIGILASMEVHLVMGASAPNLKSVEATLSRLAPDAALHTDTQDMAGLMTTADLAIGAVGSTTWERCCLGLPTICITIAENQRQIAKAAHDAGFYCWLGDLGDPGLESSLQFAFQSLRKPEARQQMSQRAAQICDGMGASRVAEVLLT